MIKKLNIALVVMVLILFGFKGLKDVLAAKKAARSGQAMAALSVDDHNAQFTPRIYSAQWHPFVNPDALSNRNGYIVDVLKAIFPRLEVKIVKGGVADYVDILKKDPDALIVNFGDHPAFAEFPKAPTPVCWMCYGLFFSRDLKWRYKGPKSLDSLRIACAESSLDSPVLRAFRDKWKDTPGKFMVVKGQKLGNPDFSGIERGEFDAFVGMLKGSHSQQARSDTYLYTHYSKSGPIDKVNTLIHCSNLNPERTKAFIAAYEKGFKEIAENGKLRRIKEYYGFHDRPEDVRW